MFSDCYEGHRALCQTTDYWSPDSLTETVFCIMNCMFLSNVIKIVLCGWLYCIFYYFLEREKTTRLNLRTDLMISAIFNIILWHYMKILLCTLVIDTLLVACTAFLLIQGNKGWWWCFLCISQSPQCPLWLYQCSIYSINSAFFVQLAFYFTAGCVVPIFSVALGCTLSHLKATHFVTCRFLWFYSYTVFYLTAACVALTLRIQQVIMQATWTINIIIFLSFSAAPLNLKWPP